MHDLDQQYYMMGDEDAGVGLHCKVCDRWRGGQPVAYLTARGDRSYEGTDVMIVYSIAGLLRSASIHTHPV